MKKIVEVILILVLGTAYLSGQQKLPDSLQLIAMRVAPDSAAKIYVKIANIYTGVNSDSVRKFARRAATLADHGSVVLGDVYIQVGNSYHMENRSDSALLNYERALRHFNKIDNKRGIGKVYQSFALVKKTSGDLAGALEDNKKALEIYEEEKWLVGIINTHNNISAIYARMSDYRNAVKYSRSALSSARELGDSLKYYNMMSEYANRLAFSGKVDSALIYLNKARPYLESQNMYGILIASYNTLSAIYLDPKYRDLRAAREAIYQTRAFVIKSGAVDNLRYVYKDLFNLYLLQNNKDSAAFFYDRTVGFIDSLTAQNAVALSKEVETKYETEKKELQIERQALELLSQQKESAMRTRQLFLVISALVIILVFAVVLYRSLVKVRKFNSIISEQKRETELQRDQIEKQKELIEEKQKEIVDSINYARRIQQAVLPGLDVWNSIAKESFVIFRPKDIVSGDFYWAYQVSKEVGIIALADCTGHGVPGAFMSMMGNSFLNEIVVENKVYDPAKILNILREKIISALGREGNIRQSDGMDISLCSINKKNCSLTFAGAHNNLLVIKNGSLEELKADRMPVGTYVGEMQPFSEQKIDLKSGDAFYLLTDGFSDQFGGPNHKKFTLKKVRQLLLEISEEQMDRQKQILEKTFSEWQMSLEQVDDVSMIGIKV